MILRSTRRFSFAFAILNRKEENNRDNMKRKMSKVKRKNEKKKKFNREEAAKYADVFYEPNN